MCSDRRGLVIAAALALVAGAACSSPDAPSELAVTVADVTPGCVDPGGHVVVHGSLPVSPSTSLSGGATSVDRSYRASVGAHELANVTWKDAASLDADVPTDVPAGQYDLVVMSPFGTTATVPLQVGGCSALAITSTTVAPNTVTVGQDVTVTATVRNGGTSAVDAVSGVVTPPANGFDPTPVASSAGPQALAAGASVDFSWTFRSTAVTPLPGVTFSVGATGTNSTGGAISAAPRTTGLVLVNPPATLTASATASPQAVNVGQTVTYNVLVTNTGAAPALVVADLKGDEPGATVTAGPAPSPQSVAPQGQVTISRTFTSSAPGTLTLTATLTATDQNTHQPVTVAPVAPVTVAVTQPAVLSISATNVTPAAVAPGATVTVTADVTNTGQTTAIGVVASIALAPPGFTPAAGGNATPRDIAGGATSQFVFLYTAPLTGTGGPFQINATGTDANTLAPITPAPLPVSTAAVAITYAIGGNASGLSGSLVLTNTDTTTNATEDIIVAAPGGGFTFPTRIASGHGYRVTVNTAPAGQTCGVANGTGTVGTANVTNVAVTCSNNAVPLSTGTTGNGAGTLRCNNATCAATYPFGTVVNITPNPATGSSFTGWSGDCTGTGACSVTMDRPRSVTGAFTLNTFTLTANVIGSGTIACNGQPCQTSYNYGTALSIVATPAAGASFDGWSGACNGRGTCSLTMTANRTITATFTTNTYAIGGAVTGLTGTLVLVDNGADDLTRNSNGPFSFATRLPTGSPYSVTVKTQPAGQVCTVQNGSGTVGTADVTSVAVTCTSVAALTTTSASAAPTEVAVSANVTVTATVHNSGQDAATGVVATVASAPASYSFVSADAGPKTIAGGGSATFSFVYQANAGSTGGAFSIDASGQDATTLQTVVAPRVSTNTVATTYAIVASVSGLAAGESVTLASGSDVSPPLTVDGSFTFPTRVASGAAYAVTVQTQPATQTCTVSGGTGSVGTADVAVSVNCQ